MPGETSSRKTKGIGAVLSWRCLGRLPAGSPKGWGRALAQLLTGTVRNLPLTLSEHEIIRLILDSENFINLKIWQIGGGAGL